MVEDSKYTRLEAENHHLREQLAILRGEQPPTYTMHLSPPPRDRGIVVTFSNAVNAGYMIEVVATPRGLKLFNSNDPILTISDLWIIGSAPTDYNSLLSLEFSAQTIRTRLRKLERIGAIKLSFVKG